MAVKPNVDPKWSSNNVATDNIEPTQALKDSGIASGSVFGREHLNWMFNAFSQWIDWVRSYALDKDNNLSELTDFNTARTNLGLNTSATNISANTLGSAARLTTARTIGGVSFDGTTNINLPGVNQTGNQNTTGNAATATKLATARTFDITGDITATAQSFDGTGNVAISASVNNDSHSHSSSTITSISTSVANNAIAGGSGGAVGTYAFAQRLTGGSTTLGTTVSGSSLKTAHADGSIEGPETTLSGTWRCMGMTEYSAEFDRRGPATTLWLRIS